MTQIGAISVKISADDSEFQRANKRTQSGLGEMAGKLRTSANQYAKWGAAAGAAAVAATAAIVGSTSRQIKELSILSQVANVNIGDMQKMSYAAKSFGIEQDKLADILKDVNDRVGDFNATGGGPMADFFNNIAPKVGVTAEQFKNLSGKDALQLYVSSLEKANLSQADMTFYMEAMASDSTRLLPLLKNNGEALAVMSDEAERLGLSLSEIDAAKVENAMQSMQRVNAVFEGAAQQLTVELMPIVGALADEFVELVVEAGGFGAVIGRVMDYSTKAVGVFANGLRGIQIIAKGLEAAFEGFAFVINRVFLAVSRSIDRLINGSIGAINGLTAQLNKILPGEGIAAINAFVNPATKLFTENTQYWSEAMQVSLKEMHDLAMQPLPYTGIDAWVDEVRAKAEVAAKAIASASGGVSVGASGGSVGLTGEQKTALEERIEAIRQAGLTESQVLQEKYTLDAEALYAALENKIITQEQFDLLAQESAMRHQEALTAIDQEAADARTAIAERERQSKLALVQGMFGNLSTLMNTGSKKLFAIGKAASIANALVSGYEAVVSSYAAGSKIGGPPVGAAFAATAAAATMAQIQQIKSQKLGGAGGGAVNFQNGQPSVNVNGGGAVGPQQPSRNISISLTGSSFGAGGIRDLISEINAAVGDGVRLNVTG